MTTILIIFAVLIFVYGIRLDLLCNKKEVHDHTVWQMQQLNKAFEYRMKMLNSISKRIN